MKSIKYKYIKIVAGAIIVAGFFVGAIIYFSGERAGEVKEQGVFPTREIPEGWREYQSNWYDFSLLYPNDLAVNELSESAGINTNTIVFENAEKKLGFQIFAIPYGDVQVTEERFLLDVPLGIRENPVEFLVDGVTVTSFYSKSLELGDTYEIWFIHEGVLYEVTVPRKQEAWLLEIMKTWRFISRKQ